jgi:hypothetical protein
MAFDCIALHYCIVFLSYGIVRWSIVFLVLDLTWLSWSVVWRLLSLSWLLYSLSLSSTGVMRGRWSKPCFDFAWLCLIFLDLTGGLRRKPRSDFAWFCWIWGVALGENLVRTGLDFAWFLLDLRRRFRRKPRQDWAWLCLIFAILLLLCCFIFLDFPWSEAWDWAKTLLGLGFTLLDLRRRSRRKPCSDLALFCVIFAIAWLDFAWSDA